MPDQAIEEAQEQIEDAQEEVEAAQVEVKENGPTRASARSRRE